MHRIGRQIIKLNEVDSTNSYAQNLITSNKHTEGTIVLADFQTSGRGQGSNGWESEKSSNILMSLIIMPHFLTPTQQFYLNMAVSLAVSNAVREVADIKAIIKWPNDILVNQKKIAGILIRNTIDSKRINSSVIGIGLNVNQTKFQDHVLTPTSLLLETGVKKELTEVFDFLILKLRNYYDMLSENKFEKLKSLYLSELLFYKQEILLRHFDHGEIKGVLSDLTEFGELLVLTENGLMTFNHDQVRIII